MLANMFNQSAGSLQGPQPGQPNQQQQQRQQQAAMSNPFMQQLMTAPKPMPVQWIQPPGGGPRLGQMG
jgi:hypothetical protein